MLTWKFAEKINFNSVNEAALDPQKTAHADGTQKTWTSCITGDHETTIRNLHG